MKKKQQARYGQSGGQGSSSKSHGGNKKQSDRRKRGSIHENFSWGFVADDGDNPYEDHDDSELPSYGKFLSETDWDDIPEEDEKPAAKTKTSSRRKKKGAKAAPTVREEQEPETPTKKAAPPAKKAASTKATKKNSPKTTAPNASIPKSDPTNFLFGDDEWEDDDDLSLPSYGRSKQAKMVPATTVTVTATEKNVSTRESGKKAAVAKAVVKKDASAPVKTTEQKKKTQPQPEKKTPRDSAASKERPPVREKAAPHKMTPPKGETLSPKAASAKSVEDSVERFVEKTVRASAAKTPKKEELPLQEVRSLDGRRKPDSSSDAYTSIPPLPRRERLRWDPEKREYVSDSPQKSPPKAAEPKAKPKTQEQKSTPKAAVKSPEKVAEQPAEVPAKKTKKAQTPKPQKTAAPRSQAETEDVKRPWEAERKGRETHRGAMPQVMPEDELPDERDVETSAEGFKKLNLSQTMLESLEVARYQEPTPIQAGVIPSVLKGIDVLGQAQTGTGKTAAYLIPIIEGVEECDPGEHPVALVLVPTRELAVQVRDEALKLSYGRDIRTIAVYGGKPIAKQISRLHDGVDLVIGTPGRIKDLMKRNVLHFSQLRWAVLDEADRMLDIGFRPDIEKILAETPTSRQTLLYSATMPPQVVRLAKKYMRDPEILDFSSKNLAVDTIDQYYITVDQMRKFDALVHLLQQEQPQQAIVFCRTKRGADRLGRMLETRFSEVATIHGDLQQTHRDRVMGRFRSGSLKLLVATDVVGRGIDVSGISHIINYDIPSFCDDYVHRVGRTGRMGREGVAYTFVTAEQGTELTRIEMRINRLLERAELKGFEAFAKPTDSTITDPFGPPEAKPVFGKPTRKIRRAL